MRFNKLVRLIAGTNGDTKVLIYLVIPPPVANTPEVEEVSEF